MGSIPEHFLRFNPGRILPACLLLCIIPVFSIPANQDNFSEAAELDELEKAVLSMKPDPSRPQDAFVMVALEEAIKAKREKSGGVGACLVKESTGEIVARGHNRQFTTWFRSDMHAEMDLMNRYEDQMKVTRGQGNTTFNPRQVNGLVLYSSVEPCPMCLTRIINTGLKKAYYAAPDHEGGMVHKINDLPAFWKDAAAGRTYAEADCSPAMKEVAARLFRNGRRNIKN
jgi:tRNA(adenine34) deaminase